MKHIYFLLPLVLMCTLIVQAQQVQIKETYADIGGGNHNALETTIFKSDEKSVEKEWKQLMKDYNAEDISVKKEIIADNAKIKSISDNTIDIYAKVKEKGDGEVQLIVAFDLGGAYLSSGQHSGMFDAAMQFVRDFAVKITTEAYQAYLDEETRNLDKLTKNQERLMRDKEHLEKEIEDYQARIENNQKEIEEITKELETKKEEIETQNKLLESITKEKEAIK